MTDNKIINNTEAVNTAAVNTEAVNTEAVNTEAVNTKEICTICYTDLDDTGYKLKCGHSFHYECLINSIKYISKNYNIYSNLYKKYNKICPYCRTPINNIELRPGYSYIKNIHAPNSILDSKYKCIAILKSGKNKGKPCGCRIKTDQYCGRHLPKT